MTYHNIERRILKYLKDKPEGAIIQNFVDDFKINRYTILKSLLRLCAKGLVEEITYTQNCRVYRLK